MQPPSGNIEALLIIGMSPQTDSRKVGQTRVERLDGPLGPGVDRKVPPRDAIPPEAIDHLLGCDHRDAEQAALVVGVAQRVLDEPRWLRQRQLVFRHGHLGHDEEAAQVATELGGLGQGAKRARRRERGGDLPAALLLEG